jgi:hypothetical protein
VDGELVSAPTDQRLYHAVILTDESGVGWMTLTINSEEEGVCDFYYTERRVV